MSSLHGRLAATALTGLSLRDFHEVDEGNHFAGWQEPKLFAREVRADFRPCVSRHSQPVRLVVPSC